MPQDISPYYAFNGGLDLASPALGVPQGRVIACMNYEALAEGYGRVDGFERFDGRTPPSAVQFWTMAFTQGNLAIVEGVTITGQASGASARVITEPHGFTGDWSNGTGAGLLVLDLVQGAFQDGETLIVAGLPRARGSVAIEADAPNAALAKDWLRIVQGWQRGDVMRVPGSGPVRGVSELNGTMYAWRDNAAGTASVMYKATPAGWSAIPMPKMMRFVGGLLEITEGQTVQGATSGRTAVVKRIVRQTGDWGSTAAGYIIFAPGTPNFTDGEDLWVNGVKSANVGLTSTVGFAPGGRFMTLLHNFYGSASTLRMYGCNGQGPAFEFDGSIVVPIESGMSPDKPTRIFEIGNHLGLTFAGGAFQTSSIGEPTLFDAITGAAAFGMGTEITDVLQATESAVVLFGQQKIGTLTGKDAATFQFEELTEEAGAEPWTAQRIGQTVYMDRRGLRSLAATSAFGNFKTGTLADTITSYFRSKRKAGAVPVVSMVCRSKSHYRLFWSDGTGLSVFMGSKNPAPMLFEMSGVQAFCGHTAELSDGTEGMFIGAEDGFVYRLDSGTSFDGEAVRAFVMTPFNPLGSALVEKRLHKITVELEAQPETHIGITAQYNYGDGLQPVSGKQAFMVMGGREDLDFVIQGGGGSWNAVNWNEFFWSAPLEAQAEAFIDGMGKTVSVIFAALSDPLEAAHVLQAYIIHYSKRKMTR